MPPFHPPVRIVFSATDSHGTESGSETAARNIFLRLDNELKMEFVHVPAGEFLMGSDPQKDVWADYHERPQHRVNLPEYWIGRAPVTNAQYAAFVRATGASAPAHWCASQPPQELMDHPVVSVSWDEAAAFCQWLSRLTGRQLGLPSEAQWEKAARGTDGRLYPWGDAAPDATRGNFNRGHQTTPVGRYSPQGDSPYGCVDMVGNVLEWCADWFEDTYYRHSPADSPPGPDSGEQRVVRGSSFFDTAGFVRAARRGGVPPTFSHCLWGFRCVLLAAS